MKHVVLIGDSIRMAYEEGVRKRLADIAATWGPAENGGNSANVLAHLDDWVIERAPDVLHLNCGLHDLKRERDAGGPAIDLAAYRENLTRIISRIRAETDLQVVWAHTTPVNEAWHHARKSFDRLEEDVRLYNSTAAEVMGPYDVPINDLYAHINELGRDSLLNPDGVHFTDEGSDRLAERVAGFIRPCLEGPV